ncbi:MAG: hypothetical protein Ta2B_17920 [Termitinemataceae bacterium]|nr:MAG: hypothetical protein Ta2B_17920 [Termitinemataceae bacterium]
MAEANTRESNFELLRIVSMFLIVFYHLLRTPSSAITNAFYVVLHIAVPCFVLISGYFRINASVKGLLKLFLRCAVYAIGLYSAYCITRHVQVSKKELLKSFFAFSHTPGLWFITTYVFLYLISPLINIALKQANTKQKFVFIMVTGIITGWFGFVNQCLTLEDGKNIVNFIFLYCIGDFIHNNIDNSKLKVKRHLLLLAYLLVNIGLFLILIFTERYLFLQKVLMKIFFPYNSPGLILNSILCFLVFSTIELKSVKINWIASSVLAIYLIHSNNYFIVLLNKIVAHFYDQSSNFGVFCLLLALFSIVVCIICVLTDKITAFIRNPVEIILYKKIGFYKIDLFLKKEFG